VKAVQLPSPSPSAAKKYGGDHLALQAQLAMLLTSQCQSGLTPQCQSDLLEPTDTEQEHLQPMKLTCVGRQHMFALPSLVHLQVDCSESLFWLKLSSLSCQKKP
jgi:hypothetical protein